MAISIARDTMIARCLFARPSRCAEEILSWNLGEASVLHRVAHAVLK